MKKVLLFGALVAGSLSSMAQQWTPGTATSSDAISRSGIVSITGGYGDKFNTAAGGPGGGGSIYLNESGIRGLVFSKGFNLGSYTVPGFDGIVLIGEGKSQYSGGTTTANDLGIFGGAGYKLVLGANKQQHLTIDVAGKVSVGNALLSTSKYVTNTAYNVKLSVNGTVIARRLICAPQSGNWPDYVFDKGYQLQSLAETEAFVNANKHLPGIPDAADIEANGIDATEMLRLQMQKIEELTLHLIEQEKKINSLSTELAQMKSDKK